MPAPPAVAATGDTVDVAIEAYAFRPNRIVIPRGTAVRFTNRDRLAHTVTENGDGLDSGEIPPGESRRLVFDRPGPHPFHCPPHPFMTGTVEVGAR